MSTYFTSLTAPTLFPYFAIGNFIFSHAALSTRFVKISYGLDHNVNPREDLTKYGPTAVEKGKITKQQLEAIQRQQGAHENSVAHYPVFLAALIYAQYAGLPNATINKICALYTMTRVLYAISYVKITDAKTSFLRSGLWWTSNFILFYTFWKGGARLNAGL